jgi:hypothetical protein
MEMISSAIEPCLRFMHRPFTSSDMCRLEAAGADHQIHRSVPFARQYCVPRCARTLPPLIPLPEDIELASLWNYNNKYIPTSCRIYSMVNSPEHMSH